MFTKIYMIGYRVGNYTGFDGFCQVLMEKLDTLSAKSPLDRVL